MPIWAYEISPALLFILLILLIEGVSLAGLLITRKLLLPRFHYHEGVNDAVSGTVQAIGVFYGITVGLIAVAVWNTNSDAANLVSREATSIATLYRDIGGYPDPIRQNLRAKLKEYTVYVINEAWPDQQKGIIGDKGSVLLDDFQDVLYTYEPKTEGQNAIHRESVSAYNKLIEARRLRLDAVSSGLSPMMWWVIWVGAAISIGVAYLYRIEDAKLHSLLVLLMSGFLGVLLFMITINDKPFYGTVSVSADAYKLILERVINVTR